MVRYGKQQRVLAIALAGLAGFVDAVGFLRLGGMFVSFMSGNSTRMAVGAAYQARTGLTAAMLIVAFVGGVVAGVVAGRMGGRWRKPAVLGFVTLMLLLAAICATILRAAAWPTLLMACAMGAANDVFQRDGEVSVGVTYMTGTLVKFGQHLAAALFAGGATLAWLPYLLLWVGLVGGAVAGAASFSLFGMQAVWIAAAAAAVLTAFAAALGPLPAEPGPRGA